MSRSPSASPTAATIAVAFRAPMPGIVASRRAGAELRAALDELAIEGFDAGVELRPFASASRRSAS